MGFIHFIVNLARPHWKEKQFAIQYCNYLSLSVCIVAKSNKIISPELELNAMMGILYTTVLYQDQYCSVKLKLFN